ncbi:unnamed protein product, partial [Mesorhabditis spiculigera]
MLAYVSRLREVNPILNAVAEDYGEKALNRAQEIDVILQKSSEDERQEIYKKQPLLGIPFTCKDLYDIEGTKTTWGTWNRRDNVSNHTHVVIQTMIDAGAIPLAKTTVPEGCVFIESVNPIQGTTNNPYDTRRNAGGSSGGEAALNGVYGFKPSVGAFPKADLVGNPVEPLWNCFGPLCRYAEDVELMLKLFCTGERSSHVKSAEHFVIKDFLVPIDIPTPWIAKNTAENQKIAGEVAKVLSAEYDVPVGTIDVSPMKSDYIDVYIANYDAYPTKQNLPEALKSRMLAAGKKNFHAITEIPKWLLGKSKHYLAAILLFHFFKRKYTDTERDLYVLKLEKQIVHFRKLLSNNKFIIQPSWPNLAGFHHAELSTPSLGHTAIYNLLDLPAIACPVGLNDGGLPLSVTVIGPYGSEWKLLEIAKKLEELYSGWKEPGSKKHH